jgi:mannose-6-phosphate isomerase-like protein (cupin superfamily)
MAYDVVDANDLEGEGPMGAVRFVRRRLNVTAFGINWYELGPGQTGREHDESASGQEEVYVIVRGSGTMKIDGEVVPLRTGTFVRVDPGSTRVPTAGDAGLTFVAVGSPPGQSYEPRGPF